MSYGVRQFAGWSGWGWEVYEGPPEGGLTLSQAFSRGKLLASWGCERLATDWISKWPDWSLPVAGTVGEGGRIEQ